MQHKTYFPIQLNIFVKVSSLPCRVPHQTERAVPLLAWPLYAWRKVCTMPESPWHTTSALHGWSMPAPGTPEGPEWWDSKWSGKLL